MISDPKPKKTMLQQKIRLQASITNQKKNQEHGNMAIFWLSP